MDSEIIGAVLGPLVTALLAIVAYVFQDWRTKRRWESDRERSVSQGIQEVQYLDLWLSAMNRIGVHDPDRELKQERALADLERSYRVMAFDLADDGPRPHSRSLREHLGWFLLFPLSSTGAKVVRVFYLVSLSVAIVWAAAIASAFDARSEMGIWVEIVVSMFLTVAGFVPTLLLAVWARHLEHRHQRAQQTEPTRQIDPAWPPGPFQPIPQPGPHPSAGRMPPPPTTPAHPRPPAGPSGAWPPPRP